MRRRLPLALLGLLLTLLIGCAYRGKDRVIVLGLDGLDPRVVDLLIGEGKLPHFARLRGEGAHGLLSGAPPLISPVLWTTIATGKPADLHGINHFVAVNPKTGAKLPVTSAMRKVRAIWQIASAAGRKVDVVGWWATWPAESVNGSVVSDHTCYHFLFGQGLSGGKDAAGLTAPAALMDAIAPLVRRPTDITPEELAPFITVDAAELARPFDFKDPLSHFKWALASADSYRRIGLALWKRDEPQLLMVYFEATDSASHLFGHLFRTQGLAGELAEEQRRYGSAVEEMYRYADRLVGEYMDAMDGRTTLVVLSDHGFDLGALPADPTEVRDLRRVSERYHRPEGILYLYGRHVKPGALPSPADQLDVAPTLLALLGVGKGNDMPGRVLAEALVVAAPPAVATYETGAPRPEAATAGDTDVDPEILSRLQSLGYLGATDSAPGRRNVAERRFAEGDYAEAAKIFGELVKGDPKDASLRTSLAGALAGLERYDDALKELKIAVELDPANAAAYHNRGAIHELRGRQQDAIKEYRTALRYKPDYAPSREALARLVPEGRGPEADGAKPRSAAEKRAAVLAEQARDAAQRGDFPGASRLLEEAEREAPRLALVYQYKANVAYLMNDRPAAIAALKKALAIEPDNALFRTNLKALEDEGRR